MHTNTIMSLFHTSIYQRLRSKHGDQKLKLLLWGCSMLILLVSVASFSCLATRFKQSKVKSFPTQIHTSTVSRAMVSACKNTLYKQTCISSLTSAATVPPKSPKLLFNLSIQHAFNRARSARSHVRNTTILDQFGHHKIPTGTDDCADLLDDSLTQLENVLVGGKMSSPGDIRTWLSAALTNQETCRESLKRVNASLGKTLMEETNSLSQLISNSLAMHKSLGAKRGGSVGRRLMSDGFPSWVSASDRKLLATSVEELRPHAVVAMDGNGTHASIEEALKATADGRRGGRTVIHVKAGTYKGLSVPHNNVMLVGDGKGVTVITGSKSYGDGYTTYNSATFGVNGDGFMARDMSFVNTAGPSKHQAVALRVGSDRAVIYRCAIEGDQDTLYALSKRQFYRDNDIFGTIDFIFGNAAALFQSCNIFAKRAGTFRRNFVTAQGRSDPNENTGFSIQNCKISAASGTESYLGRPWKEYSRTVVMQSYIDGSIQRAGWYPWSGNFALKTLFYGEFMNRGSGAATGGRVRWPGYHPSMSSAQAVKFTATEFISANMWLPATGVPYEGGL